MDALSEIYMTPDQVAERLQINPETVRRWLRAKKLRASRISAKAWRISEKDLADFVKQNERADAPQKPNFVDFLRGSPLTGSDLVFERIHDSPRSVDL